MRLVMTQDNIATFELQALRVMATLYTEHPRVSHVVCQSLLVGHHDMNDPDYRLRFKEAAGTIRWLHRNGVVIGDLHAGEDLAAIGDAQLSLTAYAKLRAAEGETGKSLGRIIIETLAKGRGPETAALAARVMALLCDREDPFRRVNQPTGLNW